MSREVVASGPSTSQNASIFVSQFFLRGLVLNCPNCGENVGRDDKLRVHLKERVCPSQFPCGFEGCEEKFQTKTLAKYHKRDAHV